ARARAVPDRPPRRPAARGPRAPGAAGARGGGGAMTPHLGTWISALADGQLDPEARERALGHVAGCPSCAEELAAVRAARRALADAGDVPVAPDLTGRLLALGA